jgi:hypothetical protein
MTKIIHWEHMREHSYVDIKLMKAKSFTEGIKKLTVKKDAEKNPIIRFLKEKNKNSKKLERIKTENVLSVNQNY